MNGPDIEFTNAVIGDKKRYQSFGMKKEQLQKVLEDISDVKIAVLGDFCLDAYWFIDESGSEISIETNQATRPVSQQRYTLGGAGNVACNLSALNVKDVRAFGVIGGDPYGAEMVRIMKKTGINTENLLIQEKDWYTHTYAKPYIGDYELNRIDFGNYNQLSKATAHCLIERLIQTISEVDLVIINQQVPSGIHTDYFKKLLAEVILQFPKMTFMVDSRNFNDYYEGAIRKMNDTEAARLCGHSKKADEEVSYTEVVMSAKELYRRYQKPVFVTRGRKGSLTIDERGISEIPGLVILSKVDTVGAGDSYLAGAASSLAAGYPMKVAAQMGSFVAGVTVQKLLQTGTASPEEILSIGADADFIYFPDLAEDTRQANYFPDTEIEIITEWEGRPQIRYAIFDHDGTLSTLREGWELIMGPMMIKAILGENYFHSDKTLFNRIKGRVDEFIDQTTGFQTLVQMKGLIELIREFGFVPEEKILDEFGYKKVYNEELMRMVKVREEKFLKGELSVVDFTIKDAIPFLQKLYDSGIKLYLASGTDVADVRSEAAVLGYAHLFEERIFGAVGDPAKEVKKIVLDQILDSIGDSVYGAIATFGDGPVEMRETRKRGGLTIGIASNELRRYGLNEHKRTRLIKAGADVIVPDFSQSKQLLRLLNI